MSAGAGLEAPFGTNTKAGTRTSGVVLNQTFSRM